MKTDNLVRDNHRDTIAAMRASTLLIIIGIFSVHVLAQAPSEPTTAPSVASAQVAVSLPTTRDSRTLAERGIARVLGSEVFADYSFMLVNVSPSGQRMAAVASNRQIGIWDTQTGGSIYMIDGFFSAQSLTMLDDNTLLIASGVDRTESLSCIELSPSKLRWSLRAEKEDVGLVRAIASPDGSRVLLPTAGKLELWETTRGKKIARLCETKAAPLLSQSGSHLPSWHFVDNGRKIMVIFTDGLVKSYDGVTGRELDETFKLDDGDQLACPVGKGSRMIVGRYDEDAAVLDVLSAKRSVAPFTPRYAGEFAGVRYISVSPGGKFACSSCATALRVWDISQDKPSLVLERPGISGEVHWLGTQEAILVAGGSRRPRVIELPGGRDRFDIGDFPLARSVSVSPSRRKMLIEAIAGREFAVADIESGKIEHRSTESDQGLFSSQQAPMMLAADDRVVRMTQGGVIERKAPDWQPRFIYRRSQDPAPIGTLMLNSDASRLFYLNGDYAIVAVDLSGKSKAAVVAGDGREPPHYLAIHPTRPWIIGVHTRWVRVWDYQQQKLLHETPLEASISVQPFISPNGRWMYITPTADTELWSIPESPEEAPKRKSALSGRLTIYGFSPTSRCFVSSSNKGVAVFESETGKPVTVLQAVPRRVPQPGAGVDVRFRVAAWLNDARIAVVQPNATICVYDLASKLRCDIQARSEKLPTEESALWDLLRDDDPAVAYQAGMVLQDRKRLAALVGNVADDDKDITQKRQRAGELLKAFSDSDESKRNGAHREIERLGPDVAPVLREALPRSEGESKERIESLLRLFGTAKQAKDSSLQISRAREIIAWTPSDAAK